MPEASQPPEIKRRLAIAGPSSSRVLRLRGGLIRECASRNVAVAVMSPEMRAEDAPALISLGVEFSSFALKPGSFSPWPERKAISAFAEEIAKRSPNALLAFGNIAPFAVRAAAKARVPRIGLMVNELPGGKIDRRLAGALAAAHTVFAHNSRDEGILRGLKRRGEVMLVPGAGADLAGFGDLPLPALASPVSFVASARLDRIKGVVEYLEAARMVKSETDAAAFFLTGPEGAGTSAVGTEIISRYADCVTYLGDVPDLREVFRTTHVFVSPSHLEGMPHAVLQALSAGRPVIATDIPGSRDTVDDMANGTLVAPGSAEALANGIKRLLKHKDLLPAMSRASRAKAERHFEMSVVNTKILEALQLS